MRNFCSSQTYMSHSTSFTHPCFRRCTRVGRTRSTETGEFCQHVSSDGLNRKPWSGHKGADQCPASASCRLAALVSSGRVQTIGFREGKNFTLPKVAKQSDANGSSESGCVPAWGNGSCSVELPLPHSSSSFTMMLNVGCRQHLDCHEEDRDGALACWRLAAAEACL